MTLKHTRQDILEYKDYRSFLKKIFHDLKTEKGNKISLESVSRKIRISKSYFRLILEGKRHITLDLVPKIAKAFALSRREQQALCYMVCRDTCKDKESKSFFEAVLHSLKDLGVDEFLKEKLVDTKSPKEEYLFKNWLCMVIHSLAKQRSFKPDPQWIQSRLVNKEIALDEIRRALDFLISSECLVQNEQGKWTPAAFVFNKPGEDVLTGFAVYNVGMAAMRPVTLKPEDYKPNHFAMMSLSYNEENIEKAVELVINCRNALIKLSQDSVLPPSYVTIVNLNLASFVRPEK